MIEEFRFLYFIFLPLLVIRHYGLCFQFDVGLFLGGAFQYSLSLLNISSTLLLPVVTCFLMRDTRLLQSYQSF